MTSVLGFGGYVPDRVMTNDDWAAIVDTTDEWITTRTGIKERRFAADDQSTLDLSEQAALRAMKDAGLSPGDIDEIIVATDTPRGLHARHCFLAAGSARMPVRPHLRPRGERLRRLDPGHRRCSIPHCLRAEEDPRGGR